jgi:phenylpropionate dioxygenase-like ring-hydroxylating dioxygenase large terminal subunit
MIPNQWYAVLESRQVKRNKPVGVTRLGEKLVFWRDQHGQVICLRDQCRHRGAALSQGKVLNDHIQCPFHGFEYDPSGQCVLIPARGENAPLPKNYTVQSYPIQEAHDFIWLWWGEPRQKYPQIPWFEDLDAHWSYGRDFDLWPVHYSRAIENQLDVFHLPFVHHNTIGRGERFVSDGPITQLEGDTLKVWVRNRHDKGEQARMASALPQPSDPAMLHFKFPHLWMNRISADFRIVIAFVPVDEGNTRFYLRYYQRMINLPILRGLVNLMAAIGSRAIVKQDRSVVINQQPIKSTYRMDERLIHADRPIIQYRQHREALISQAGDSAPSNQGK